MARKVKPLTRKEKVCAVKIRSFMQKAEIFTPDKSKALVQSWEKRVLALGKCEDFPPEGHFVLASSLLMQEKDIKAAQKSCHAAIAGAHENSLIYAKSMAMKAEIEATIDGFYTSQCCMDYFVALEKGEPLATIPCMAIKMGTYLQISAVRWTDIPGIIDIARKYPTIKENMTRKIAQEFAQLSLSGNPFNKLANEVMRAMDDICYHDTTRSELSFVKQICDLFTEPDDQRARIDYAIRQLFSRDGGFWQSGIFQGIYLYAQLIRYGENRSILQKLAAIDQESCHLLAAKALLRNPKETATALAHLSQITTLPDAYLLSYEIHLRANNFKNAYKAILNGIEQINGFLNGKEKLYNHFLGDQADTMLLHSATGYMQNIECVDQHINQIILDELFYAFQLLRKLQLHADLLLDILKKEKAREKSLPYPPLVNPACDTPTLATQVITGNESESAAISVPPIPSLKPTPEHTLDQAVMIPTAAPTPLPFNQSTLNRINNLMTHQAEFDQAEAMLRDFKAEPESLLWFRRQQSLCWCYIEQGSAYDYLTGKVSDGQHPKELALEKLKSAERLVKDTIRSLVKLTEKSGLALPKEEGVGRIFVGEHQDKCTEVANALEPAMRKVYGGLYSTLGHVEKAYRDNPLCYKSVHDHVKRAIEYFQIANRIRGFLGK